MAAKQPKRPHPKHVPQRTCIACRKVDAKRGLRRLVRVQDNRVAIDPTGKHAGRGAYLCAERGCWETALKRAVIERALKITSLDPDDRQALTAYAASLPVGSMEDKVEPSSPSIPPE
jgi:predicted RNA-binding protein YlxR (DUF448 family)